MRVAISPTREPGLACTRTSCMALRSFESFKPAAYPSRAAGGPVARRQRRRQRLQPSAAAQPDSEVAVFRFTLGNDAADALVPRVVGIAGAILLGLNHLLAGQEPSEAQVRAEAIGAVLAAVAYAAPAIEQRLKELQPGRGRLAAAGSVEGATSVFALPPDMPEAAKQELAWSSYALLLNTNICGLAVFWGGRAVLARGLLRVPPGGSGSAPASGAAAALASLGSTQLAAASSAWQQGALYCADRAAISSAGASGWGCVPEGAESLLLQPLQPFADGSGAAGLSQGVLLLVSERPRALSGKERAWAAVVAAKLHAALAADSRGKK